MRNFRTGLFIGAAAATVGGVTGYLIAGSGGVTLGALVAAVLMISVVLLCISD
jgi:hypothetical protein